MLSNPVHLFFTCTASATIFLGKILYHTETSPSCVLKTVISAVDPDILVMVCEMELIVAC